MTLPEDTFERTYAARNSQKMTVWRTNDKFQTSLTGAKLQSIGAIFVLKLKTLAPCQLIVAQRDDFSLAIIPL